MAAVMEFSDIVSKLSPEIYASLKQALELGKWPDGRILSEEQKSICMEAVLSWEAAKNMPAEQRTGYIDRGHKAQGEICDDEQVINIKDS